jgi:hypothetical protein
MESARTFVMLRLFLGRLFIPCISDVEILDFALASNVSVSNNQILKGTIGDWSILNSMF